MFSRQPFARTCSRCKTPPRSSTTQNRLATGNKVNSALDNPTNFFTAQGLNNRASDINNLLDSIGNGVQVLQAANTGITSLQKLVDTAKSIANQVLQAPTGYTAKSTVTSTAALVGTASAANLVDGVGFKANQTLAIAANGSLPAVTVTFGASESLDQLNAALAAGDLTASIDSTNHLVITTLRPRSARSPLGRLPVVRRSQPLSRRLPIRPRRPFAPAWWASTTTSSRRSRRPLNGINLLNGDNLKLTFDETAKSTLNITGVTYNATGLGLASLVSGTDFLDNNSANKALTLLGSASTTLRTEASALGSNPSVVQLRQDFNKSLIDVLQTGASNLTLADANEEAANSQALSTRQSIAVSALSLANQSQQSVLQLLR